MDELNLIHLVKSLVSDDTGLFQKITCSFFGKTQKLRVLNTYGIGYNPPDDSFGVAFKVNDYGNNVFVIVDRPDLRFKGLAKGEFKIGNLVENTYVYFKADGSIEIKPKSGQVVNVIGDVVVTGTVTAANFITAPVPDYNAHTHSGVDTGVGNTGGPS